MTSKIVEALQRIAEHFSSDWPERCQANVRLARAALAEHDAQQAEPQQLRKALVHLRNKASQDVCGDNYSHQDAAYLAGVEAALYEFDVALEAQPAAQQEPTQQAEPQRKPLSAEKIDAIMYAQPGNFGKGWCYNFARAIEAAHGIK